MTAPITDSIMQNALLGHLFTLSEKISRYGDKPSSETELYKVLIDKISQNYAIWSYPYPQPSSVHFSDGDSFSSDRSILQNAVDVLMKNIMNKARSSAPYLLDYISRIQVGCVLHCALLNSLTSLGKDFRGHFITPDESLTKAYKASLKSPSIYSKEPPVMNPDKGYIDMDDYLEMVTKSLQSLLKNHPEARAEYLEATLKGVGSRLITSSHSSSAMLATYLDVIYHASLLNGFDGDMARAIFMQAYLVFSDELPAAFLNPDDVANHIDDASLLKANKSHQHPSVNKENYTTINGNNVVDKLFVLLSFLQRYSEKHSDDLSHSALYNSKSEYLDHPQLNILYNVCRLLNSNNDNTFSASTDLVIRAINKLAEIGYENIDVTHSYNKGSGTLRGVLLFAFSTNEKVMADIEYKLFHQSSSHINESEGNDKSDLPFTI